MQREVDGLVELVAVKLLASRVLMETFAGDDVGRAHVAPEAPGVLASFDDFADHDEVASDSRLHIGGPPHPDRLTAHGEQRRRKARCHLCQARYYCVRIDTVVSAGIQSVVNFWGKSDMRWQARGWQGLAGAVLALTCLLSVSARAEGPDNAPVAKSLWEVTDLFSPCSGDCGVALLFGQSVSQTPMTSVFIHFQSPAYWQWDNTYIATLSAQRTWIRYGKYFTIDPEIGFGQRFGDAPGPQGWLALYVRWRYFPWSDYVRTSIGVGIGPSIAGNVAIGTWGIRNTSGVSVGNYFSPELELGLAQYPSVNLVVRYHHSSNIWDALPNNTDDAQFWTVGARIKF